MNLREPSPKNKNVPRLGDLFLTRCSVTGYVKSGNTLILDNAITIKPGSFVLLLGKTRGSVLKTKLVCVLYQSMIAVIIENSFYLCAKCYTR